jgi:hypothetical protein
MEKRLILAFPGGPRKIFSGGNGFPLHALGLFNQGDLEEFLPKAGGGVFMEQGLIHSA